MASPAWSPRCSVVVAALTVQVRGKVARLLGKAYSMLGVPTAAACLGISEAEVVDLAQERGWMVEGDGMLRILSEKEPSTHVGTATLQQLTGYVLHLER